MGAPGKYSKEDVTKKKSLSTRTIEGSGLKPGMIGLVKLMVIDGEPGIFRTCSGFISAE